jgi:NADPH-dependent curcumin reductase CurA
VSILLNELSVLGFLIFAHDDEMPHAYQELNKLIQAGKLKVRETVYDGIDKMFDAFSGLFKGENIGKAVVKA